MYASYIDEARGLPEFRSRIRQFLVDHLPVRLADTPRAGLAMPTRMQLEWQQILHSHGLGAPSWPREYGGRCWSLRQMHIWNEECANARAPRHVLQTISMLGPILMNFGSEAQKQKHLPGIVSGETMWCQGYSEPGSGSDLTSLTTRAERLGDKYIVNGRKIWTTFAHEADWIFALVRTSSEGRPQEGISFILIDMATPGIDIRPLVSIDNLHHLNEVSFDNVEVPAENLIGEENHGWTYAKALLNHERLGICDLTELRARLNLLKDFCHSDEGADFLAASVDDIVRKLALLEIEISGLEATYQRTLEDIEGGDEPGPSAASLKFIDTVLTQTLHEIGLEAAGMYAISDQSDAFDPAKQHVALGPKSLSLAYVGYAFSRANSIAGGTNEVQKNIIWRAISA